jgi:hypothetical protein
MKKTYSKNEIVNKWAVLIFAYITVVAVAASLVVMWLNRF